MSSDTSAVSGVDERTVLGTSSRAFAPEISYAGLYERLALRKSTPSSTSTPSCGPTPSYSPTPSSIPTPSRSPRPSSNSGEVADASRLDIEGASTPRRTVGRATLRWMSVLVEGADFDDYGQLRCSLRCEGAVYSTYAVAETGLDSSESQGDSEENARSMAKTFYGSGQTVYLPFSIHDFIKRPAHTLYEYTARCLRSHHTLSTKELKRAHREDPLGYTYDMVPGRNFTEFCAPPVPREPFEAFNFDPDKYWQGLVTKYEPECTDQPDDFDFLKQSPSDR